MSNAISNGAFVTPGDQLGSEEEFLPSTNAYVDDGDIRSLVTGKVIIDKGMVSVQSSGREIRTISQGDCVTGSVVGEMKSVMFIKIDSIKPNQATTLVPAKDGKIVVERAPFHRSRDFNQNSSRSDSNQTPSKLCGLGDVIIARVLLEEEDIYILDISEEELGIIHALCDICSGALVYKSNSLVCMECDAKVSKKISTLYDNSAAINEYLKSNINFGR